MSFHPGSAKWVGRILTVYDSIDRLEALHFWVEPLTRTYSFEVLDFFWNGMPTNELFFFFLDGMSAIEPLMMMIAFITFNSSLVPLLEGP